MMAIELGIDIVDHCDEMDDEVIAALVDRGTFVVPSLHFPKHFLEAFGSGLGFAADAIRDDLEHMYAAIPKAAGRRRAVPARRRLRRDRLPPRHVRRRAPPLRRARRHHARSMSIGWATRNGAALVGREHDLGTIEAGKLADLLVVDGDPTSDIGALADHSPRAVLKGGRSSPALSSEKTHRRPPISVRPRWRFTSRTSERSYRRERQGVEMSDMKLEFVLVPVSDVDRAKAFYEKAGFRFDVDTSPGEDFRVVQMTPPGSECSITIGKGITPAAPGSSAACTWS